jgi:hypothetical protein
MQTLQGLTICVMRNWVLTQDAIDSVAPFETALVVDDGVSLRK